MNGWHAGPIANAAAAEALTSILIQINRSGIVSHSGSRSSVKSTNTNWLCYDRAIFRVRVPNIP